MFLQMGADLLGAGWNLASDVVSGTGKAIGTLASGFFPSPQRTVIESNLIKQAEGSGQTFRPVTTDAPSFQETAQMFANEWLKSPYEQQYAVPAKVTESQQLAQGISQGPIESITGLLSGVAKKSGEFRTLVDEIGSAWGLDWRLGDTRGDDRPQKGTVADLHPNENQWPGADVYETVKGWGSGILEQVKGLYNVAFGQTGSQPAFAISHELQPSGKTTIGLIIAGVIILVVFVWGRKK